MHKKSLGTSRALLLVGLLGWTAAAFGASSEPAKRLHSNIQSGETFALPGHVHPLVAQGLAQDQGAVSSAKPMPRMALFFSMTPAQEADLAQLLKAQQDRRSPQFHQFLTPEQYAARFGMNSQDLAKVKAWLESSGFTNVEPSRSRRWINFEGTAGIVQYAFHTSIHNYTINGEAHIANSSDPELPKALNGVAAGIHGLHNFIPKAHLRKTAPRFTSNISGSTFIAPNDWATIYDVAKLYSAGLDGSPISNPSGNYCSGSPCSIVVVGQSDVTPTDLANFRSAAGLPAKTIFTIIPPGDNDPGLQFQSGDEGESDLDLEWSNAIAKNANVLFVTADQNPHNGVEDSIQYAIDNNVAPILSTSYGLCEVQDGTSDIAFQDGLYQQANAQGMTVVSAAGDAGAADCDTGYPATLGLAVDYPASSPYVTGVGGTQFTVYNTTGTYWGSSNDGGGGSALQYIPEVVWNDTSLTNGLASGGGGVSIYESKPTWQTGNGVPSDGHRDVPDIALTASPNEDGLLYCTPPSTTSYTSCSNGFRNSDTTLNVTGGTSAGAPTFAGVLALLVQKLGKRVGNVNANLYTLAGISQTAFHDITAGSNKVPCAVGTLNCSAGSMGYSAGVGYDQASGLGSIDAYNLTEQWTSDIQITSNPTALSIQPGNSGTTTITVAPTGGFTGTISFACTVSSSLAGVTCSLPSTTVTTSGTTTLTVTASSTAASPWWRRFRNVPPTGIGLLLVGLAMAASLVWMRKQRFVHAWGAAAMLALLLGAVSCGGGSSSGSGTGGTGSAGGGSTAESGTVTVTATSGQIVNSVSIAVTIP